MDIKDSYLHGTVGVVKSISVSADKLTYNLADINNTARTITLPLATTTANGLMSKDDKIAINSLGNYVTLNTNQEITGIKTFTKQLKFTVAKGTAPFLVTSDTKVTNLNADLLGGYHSRSYLPYTIYSYLLGCLVKTDIPTNSNTMVTFIIEGNSYNANSIFTTGEFYNYKDGDKILSYGAYHHGYNFGNIIVFCYDGYVYIWFKLSRTYLSFVVTVYGTNSSPNNINRVTSITDASLPTTGITRKVEITPKISLNSSNYTSYIKESNFPGLNKVGTVTSVAIANGGGLSVIGSPITTSGTITITNTGVRSVTIGTGDNANKVEVNTGGTTTYLTIPYAIYSTHLIGGALGSIPYQSAADTTTFLAAPTTNGYVLKYNTTDKKPYWAADSDTKNTAGSTNSTSKLFLIGATSLVSNSLTYSNSSVYTTNGTLYATSFIGNLDGTYVNKLTNYTKATTIGSIATTDSLNTALGKLEFKTDFIYNDLFGTDNDDVINKWHEIVDFIDSVKEGTDITDEFVTRKTNLTITGAKSFSTVVNITGASSFAEGIRLHHLGGLSSLWFGAVNNSGYDPGMWGITVNNNGMRFRGTNSTTGTNPSDYVNIIHGGNVGIGTTNPSQKLHVNGNILAAKFITSGGTSSLFVKGDGSLDSTSYATTSSLANYVTLNTTLTISGVKTFSTLLKFTVAQGTSPFTVTSTTIVANLNADLLDGYHIDDILPYGLENLCVGAVASRGNTTLNSDGSITTSGINSDTFFDVRCTEDLIAGLIYTVGFYVTGVPSGNTATWDWSFAGQKNNNLFVTIKSNGWCWGTGTISEDIAVGTNIIFDDTRRGFYSSINISKFVIVKGRQKAYYTPPISRMSVNHATSAEYLNNYTISNPNTGALKDNKVKWFAQINTSSGYAGNNYGFPTGNNANGILYLGTHPGKYGHQLGFSSNGNIYHRCQNGSDFPSTANGGSWATLLTSKNYASYLDSRYYTETEADNRFVNVTGDTMTGTLTMHTTGTGHYNQGIRINRVTTNDWALILIGKSGTATSGTGTSTSGDGAWLIGTPASSNSLIFNLNDARETVGLCLKGHGNTDMKWNNNTVWHAGNDGSESGLDADKLDGLHASDLLTSVTSTSSKNISVTVGGTTKSVTDAYAKFGVGVYTQGGGEQRPSYIGSGLVRWNMMRNTTTYYDSSLFSGYCDWMMMDTYTGTDVPYVTMIGVLKAATPHAYIASGSKGSTNGKWTIKALLDSINYTSYTPILNSSSTHATNTSVIYAPSTAGTQGLVLTSNGSGAPVWSNLSNLNVGSATTSTRSKYLETLKQNGSEWYGNQYKFYALWASSTILDLKCDGYFTRVNFAKTLYSTTVINAKEFSLSNASWTDTGYTFASLDTGTYAVQVTFGTTLVASGIMSVYKNLEDTAGDEIPLHVYGTAGWRPYLRTYANKLLISSNDTSTTSRTVTIKIALIL